MSTVCAGELKQEQLNWFKKNNKADCSDFEFLCAIMTVFFTVYINKNTWSINKTIGPRGPVSQHCHKVKTKSALYYQGRGFLKLSLKAYEAKWVLRPIDMT